MSESNLSPAPEAPMNAEDDIIEYLRKNPKFLQQNPEAMDLLVPPKTDSGKGIADFQNYMIQRLKADKEQVITTTRELVENSRANMNNQQRVHKAVLRLLEANNFEDFIQSITMDLATILDVDIAVFIVESNGGEIPHIHTSGIRIIPPGTVDKWMAGKECHAAGKYFRHRGDLRRRRGAGEIADPSAR
jgi:uncharacterized protein YigA (DUF484 family)